MLKNNKIKLIIALLVGVTLFSSFKYFLALKEKYDLEKQLNQVKEQVVALENQKQNLVQIIEKQKQIEAELTKENTGLKTDLQASTEKASKLESDLAQTQKAVEELNAQLTGLQTELTGFKAEKEKLQADLAAAFRENNDLKSRLNSIAELKKAMKELRQQMYKVGKTIKQKISSEKALEGNQGYLLKEGKSTFPPKVKKIEVNPAQTQ